MKDYESITLFCQTCTRLSASVLDQFLLHYVAPHKRLLFHIVTKLKKYRHITKVFPNTWPDSAIAQLTSHKIFKERGLIRKLIHQRVVKDRSPEEYEYLQLMAAHPWRYCFSVILDSPYKDFFLMEDVFSGKEFLLYSPGTAFYLKDHKPILWFNLIGFNSRCWQTFGPINYYNGFTPDDIFFYGTELDPSIETEKDLLRNIEDNPVPYMMLLSGANLPLIISGSFEMVMNTSQQPVDSFNPDTFHEDFMIDQHQDVIRLQLQGWNEFPHFATIYYDKANKFIHLTSQTDLGYENLIKAMGKNGLKLNHESDVRVHIAMTSTAENILKRKLVINPYDKLFDTPPDPERKGEIDVLNEMLQEIIPDLNAGKNPNIKAIARKYNQDPALLHQIIKGVQKKSVT